ncbi:MAG: hypothetical protein AAFX99_20235, partial [Myxococcota bacterium]
PLTAVLFLLAAEAWLHMLDPNRHLVPLEPRRLTSPRLTLEGGCLRLGRHSVDLQAPFRVRLTQHPGTYALGIEVVQCGIAPGDTSHRIRVQTPLSKRIGALPAYAMSGPMVDPEEVRDWLWPTLRYAAGVHGDLPPWTLTTADGSDTGQPQPPDTMATVEHTVAEAVEVQAR